jgi:ankyrin repeat protein
MLAASSGHRAVVELLLRSGADPATQVMELEL